ncbi:hypothetical protein [Streptomyces halobius]|uniref:Enoyl reductase n=1 Tax=Streptomyces halobius TaxID=2879846 RepID=A0ABY4M7I5_9ACTN|nr:hypothetical protein [Streptomyces halobius]UQA93754.1 hypothetical protein K9S39_19470 [Streptomyces halobius]
MPLKKTGRILAVALVAVTFASTSSEALANGRAPGRGPKPGSQGGQPSGEKKGQEIASKITYDLTKNGSGGSVGAVTPVGDWTPPPCWFAPKYTPDQYKAWWEDLWSYGPDEAEWVKKSKKKFGKGAPDENFHKDDTGKGYWWGHFINRDRMDETAAWECFSRDPWWVKKGEDPKVEHAISPKILAGLAYDKIRVPDTAVSMNPNGKQTVNLPTWVWLNKARFKPISVTASLPALDMSATTTAKPVSLHIEPGTQDAEVFPASGDCPINDDGSIGTPYVKGKGKQDPPCGVTYLRATTNTPPHKLKATLTWEIAWKGSGGASGDLPNGTFGTTTDITVQEAQAINR